MAAAQALPGIAIEPSAGRQRAAVSATQEPVWVR